LLPALAFLPVDGQVLLSRGEFDDLPLIGLEERIGFVAFNRLETSFNLAKSEAIVGEHPLERVSEG
jgi:hypothetical protein